VPAPAKETLVKFRPIYLVFVVIAVILVMTSLVTGGDTAGSVKNDGTVITKRVSDIEPDASAVFDIVLQEGNDAEHESTHIFQQLESPAIARVALDTQTLKLTVEYDSAQVTEPALRSLLATVGYVKRTAADATPTEVAPDGSSQTIRLVTGDVLTPSFFVAKAGVPLTITFSAGTGHLASVTIPRLGLSQTLAQDGASITIPSPVPGEYELVCQEGYSDAILLVE
jgi:ABC-type cobalt transport system substrate-binding protein